MKEEISNYLLAVEMPKRTEKNNLKFCKSCMRVYERYWTTYHGYQEIKHQDMPTYGVERRECEICEKEKNARREPSKESFKALRKSSP